MIGRHVDTSGNISLRRFFATLDATLCAIGRWLIHPIGTRIAVVTLLTIHAGLLAYSATRHSPTHLEPAFLVSGISHWQLRRFELYRVNPPLPRMIAALPVLAAGCKTDWSRFDDSPGSRPEFPLGERFVSLNGERSLWLFTLARWTCIPFSLVGGFACFLWSRDLYGSIAGLASLLLWCSSPNILAHAELVTPDAPAAALGVLAGYLFWRWLRHPTWGRALWAGLGLGLAELTKMSWLILFALWPLLWIAWHLIPRTHRFASALAETSIPRQTQPKFLGEAMQLLATLGLGLYVINVGYACDQTLMPLRDFAFVSEAFAGSRPGSKGGNRFDQTCLGAFPIPLPKQFLLGIDLQKRDFEDYDHPSYLKGTWAQRGWWYYYLYGLWVKVPHGAQVLFLVACILTVAGRGSPLRRVQRSAEPSLRITWRDELVLLAPAASLFALASSQTEFTHHFRYVLPTLALLTVFLGKTAQTAECSRLTPSLQMVLTAAIVPAATVGSVASSLWVFPHSLSYFNELAGGPANGHRHMLHSNLDWGQNLLIVKDFLRSSHDKSALLLYRGAFCPVAIGVDVPSCFTHRSRARDQSNLDQLPTCTAGHMCIVSGSDLAGDVSAVYCGNEARRVILGPRLHQQLQTFVPIAYLGGGVHVLRPP